MRRVILHLMVGGEVNPYPIQLLFNFWEFCPTLGGTAASFSKKSPLTERLDELSREGITEITSFLPWQAIETDITHMLPRFLHAAAERNFKVSLIVSPELGIHFPNSGLPKDLIRPSAEMAEHCDGVPIPVPLPPNLFVLPSYFNADFGKRYYSFLSRIDSLIGDLARVHPASVKNVTLVVSGSFWKYYRSPLRSSGGRSAFAGAAGDFSGAATVIFRQRVEQTFSQREFQDPTPISANRWKSKAMDDINWRWFQQQSEDVFRHRSFQALRKKAATTPVREVELYTPEADPGFVYSHVLAQLAGGSADWVRLSALLDEAASRLTFASASAAAPFVHWTALGGFGTLSDTQRQFLLLKSLVLMGGLGGGILIDESEWFSLSNAFRTRAGAIARLFQHGHLKLETQAGFFSPHAWSGGGILWDELKNQAGPEARLVSSFDRLLQHREVRLVVVDPTLILTNELLERLIHWAESGKTVVLPRSTLYSEAARRTLEQLAGNTRRMDVNFNIPYHLHWVGSGKLVVYEWDPAMVDGESQSLVHNFIASVLSVAEVEPVCRVSEPRAQAIALRAGKSPHRSVFILNETKQQLQTDLNFTHPVAVSDFAVSFSGNAAEANSAADAPTVSTQFTLDLAPCGLISLAIARMLEEKDPEAARDETLNPGPEAGPLSTLPPITEDIRIDMGEMNADPVECVDAAAVLEGAMGVGGFGDDPTSG